MKYNCTDGNASIEIDADSATEAAQEYVDGGDFGGDKETTWVSVRVTPIVEDEDGNEIKDEDNDLTITVEINPEEPDCEDGEEHDWQSPHEVVGGLTENPGVWGHGGGVIITEVCSHCGAYRVTDTWAQNPENGEQGLRSVEYREADEDSLAWVESLKATDED